MIHISCAFLLFFIFSCRHHREVAEGDFVIEHDEVSADDKKATEVSPFADLPFLTESLGFRPSADSDLILLWEVSGWLGTPYRYGGKSRKGIDCSGLVLIIYRDVYDIELKRRTIDMAQHSRKIRNPENLDEGDLVFFRIDGRTISHVGIYLGDDRFVHASSSRGVVINNLDEPYYSERFAFGGRITK